MDWVRSCYSTQMVMDASGVQYGVDWFFAEPGDPVFPGPHAFGSLNWSKPDYPTNPIGEVVGARRPWRDGSLPPYVTLFGALRGDPAWYLVGAPGPGPVRVPTYFGSDASLQPAGSGIGPQLFPIRWSPGYASAHTLVSAQRGPLAASGGDVYAAWYYLFPAQPDFIRLRRERRWYYACEPDDLDHLSMGVADDVGPPLRCFSVTSTQAQFDDPLGLTSLPAGDVLTLTL